jgi:hypothetical protein
VNKEKEIYSNKMRILTANVKIGPSKV